MNNPNCKPGSRYTLTEAAALLGVDASTIHRWGQGYQKKYKGEMRYYPPKIRVVYNANLGKAQYLGEDLNALYTGDRKIRIKQ